MNKRGVSPLVATLVLILLAIAMALAVMNFGRAQIPSRCSMEIGLSVVEIDRQQQACFDTETNQIKLLIQNGPLITLQRLNFKIFLEDLDVITEEPITNQIRPDEAKRFTIDFNNPKKIKEIRITPKIPDYEDTISCPDQAITIKNLREC